MIEFFGDNFLARNISDTDIKRVLKFHQSSMDIIDQGLFVEHIVNSERDEWLNRNAVNVEKSDRCISKHPVLDFSDTISKLYEVIDGFFRNTSIVTTLPIITIFSDAFKEKGLVHCSCCFDFDEASLIKFSEINNELLWTNLMLEKEIDVCISLFLDIERSFIANQNRAYTDGILQIGMLTQKIQDLCKNENTSIIQTFVNLQKFSHDIGVNLRKRLLINNIFLGGIK